MFQCILEGYYQRISQLQRYLQLLESKELSFVSDCCNKPFEDKLVLGDIKRVCVKCDNECGIREVDNNWVYNFRLKVIQELREEDKALTDFSAKMGYTAVEEQPKNIVNNRFVVLGDVKKEELDQNTVAEIESLPPMERERLRKSIESRILPQDNE